ncbi:ABC transporter ATP-binding protein [Helicobacter ailurogastricus]|uniref:Phospholipid-lipopolysaccharide ABC transporter n=1 Tax=Helicobacter ailurogastricus TaxID=1578720 RepID=A0A0K2XD26_9HELI|nr:ABC transporter ATP-binding protein [Helicobacter ailurogastricus]CRF40450.1 Phospholipid-lipopolysaccharide ABC transporter [Helicobacter ailurogastricus]CRF43423.1 Phospholipid-lipopolysaccharide ABC transporter [Helicobacter ailurogastricus]CRF43976.1 Phospholipid-lipopolysaccharide ABC transporter [Helicobacter ailurogastricus]GMB89497.1 Multidrug resistance protein HetA [Helicobacter ailurogastricus]GMB91413.1 Multidrug resistance protein HetA [Helicobacter ailurogastricus]
MASKKRFSPSKNFLRALVQIFALINKRDKKILVVLVLMSIFMSLLEVSSISMIMPFITLASSPDLVLSNPYARAIYDTLHFKTPLHFAYFFSFALVGLYVFRMGYGILFTYANSRFASQKAHALAQRLFMHHLKSSYLEHINLNLDKIRHTIMEKSGGVLMGLNALLGLLSELSVMLFLYGLLIYTNWKMTFILTFILVLQVFFITKYMSKLIQKKGHISNSTQTQSFKILSKFFGNFKLTKLKDNHEEAYQTFSQNSLNNAKANTTYRTLQAIPSRFLETVGFSLLILSVAYVLHKYGEAKMVLPIISMYALALYRMLPSLNRILEQYNTICYQQQAINSVYKDLSRFIQEEGDLALPFKERIRLEKVSFAYKRTHPILQGVDLEIKRGQKVAFIGPSGCGKSTLVDIIMGVLYPNEGQILIDNTPLTLQNIRTWRQKIGYIPQHIYLFDGSAAENVACGSPLDENRVIEVCKMAHIYDFLCQHRGIDTIIGEGGINLSGGQKQRLGIARALYDNPEILVLDEATSALDTPTETKIMEEIYSVAQGKTLLVIAHRLSTIERCDVKIDLSKPVV